MTVRKLNVDLKFSYRVLSGAIYPQGLALVSLLFLSLLDYSLTRHRTEAFLFFFVSDYATIPFSKTERDGDLDIEGI